MGISGGGFYLRDRIENEGAQYSRRCVAPILWRVPVRAFFSWLCKQNVLLANPASELELPKMEKRLPRGFLSAAEAEQVLAQPDIHDPHGLRDEVFMEGNLLFCQCFCYL